MAEDEIARHTKKIYKTWTARELGLWHKLKEFIIEIVIIVFAFSISIWFHNRSEHGYQQEDVKTFLLDLQKDLSADITEMQDDKQSYLMQKAAFSYINHARLGETLSRDSLVHYYNWIFNTTALNPNNGRFEGYKSAGKIGLNENDTCKTTLWICTRKIFPLC